MNKKNPSVSKHYDAAAKQYHLQYDRDLIFDTKLDYPSNYFRLQILLNTFVAKGIKKVIEVGVGEGTPLATLARAGTDVWGFDISREMVKKSRQRMQEAKLNPEHIFWGDIQDPATYIHAAADGQFDGLMAMGVMPHVENDDAVLDNMLALVRPGGSVFIEFRNKLFSLFTFNRFTADFILNDLLRDVSPELKKQVARDIEPRLRMDLPTRRAKVTDKNAPGYDDILSKFHNPFEVMELFRRHHCVDLKLHWYHYHPAMPYLERDNAQLFRTESVRLEHEASNWRGYFLCSAFVVEAVKATQP